MDEIYLIKTNLFCPRTHRGSHIMQMSGKISLRGHVGRRDEQIVLVSDLSPQRPFSKAFTAFTEIKKEKKTGRLASAVFSRLPLSRVHQSVITGEGHPF